MSAILYEAITCLAMIGEKIITVQYTMKKVQEC